MRFPAATLVLCLPVLATAQEFEAATIKPSAPPGPQTRFGVQGGPGTNDPGIMTWSATSLVTLVATAFEIPFDRIANPGAIKSGAFDVIAKVPAGATKQQIPAMLRKLLEERFRMTAHSEMHESSVWLMTVAKSGSKLSRSSDSDGTSQDGLRTMGTVQVDRKMFPVPARGEGATIGFNGVTHFAALGVTTGKLADLLSAAAARPIVDKSALTGTWDVRLIFTPETNRNAAPPPPGSPGPPDNLNAPPTIFEALQHDLGLRLEPGKGPVKFIVIDHMDSAPSGN